MADRLAGKVALITGTAGGHGREAALLFAREGARVVGCDVKDEEAQETVAMVRAQEPALFDDELSRDATRWRFRRRRCRFITSAGLGDRPEIPSS